MKRLKKLALLLFSLLFFGIVVVLFLSFYISHSTSDSIYSNLKDLPPAHTVIILGASVHSDGKLSPVLQDRMDTGLELYRNKKVKRFLLTGDHRTDDYNEVSAMQNYLLNLGVPGKHIFIDPGGLNTYESMYRSREVFEVPSAVVVTQPFHLPRTIFIANELGMDYTGFPADSHYYKTEASLLIREKLANIKAVFTLLNNKSSSAILSKQPITCTPQ